MSRAIIAPVDGDSLTRADSLAQATSLRKVAPSFRAFAGTHIECLRRRAERMIGSLESEGTLPPRRRTAAGVVDETLLLAWERLPEKTLCESIENWLTLLLIEVVDSAVRHANETTPVVRHSEPEDDQLDADPTSSQWRQCQILTDHDPEIWEDRFPERRDSERLRRTTLEEEREAILSFLTDLSPEDRTAFKLHAFDGYSCEEVAARQGRNPSEVRTALDVARKTLKGTSDN